LDELVLNGDADARHKGNLNISFAYVEGESLLMALKNVALSSGSACTSASLEPSYVLRALGVEEDMAHTSIRFGLGRFTTVEEVDYTAALVVKAVRRLRELSPLYEVCEQTTGALSPPSRPFSPPPCPSSSLLSPFFFFPSGVCSLIEFACLFPLRAALSSFPLQLRRWFKRELI
jgi:Aminotransferase class-V